MAAEMEGLAVALHESALKLLSEDGIKSGNLETAMGILKQIVALKESIGEARENGMLPDSSEAVTATRRERFLTAEESQTLLEQELQYSIADAILDPFLEQPNSEKMRRIFEANRKKLRGRVRDALLVTGFKITDASDATGLSESQLRYLEKYGWKAYSNRDGGQRSYTIYDIGALEIVSLLFDHEYRTENIVDYLQPIRENIIQGKDGRSRRE